MKHSHCLFTVLVMLSMVLGLFSMPAFSGGDVARAQEGNPPPASNEVQWELGFTNLDSELLAQSESVVGGLAAEGVVVNQSTDQVHLSGSDEMLDMRAMMFDNIAPLDFLGGVVEMTVYLPAEGELDLVLEARVTTGYRWEVAAVDGVAVKASEPKYQQYYPGVGASSLETIHIQGPAGTAVQLLYRRPFGQKEPAHASLNINLSEGTAVLELSDPTPPVLIAEEEINSSQATPAADLPQALALPTTLDWREAGIVTDVRNQGSYGSCWAFGTVGVMESAIAKAGGQLTDLSEQFLVSCNKDGWGNGGLTAHKYHYNTLGIAQAAIGAVLEANKPYSASKGTCTTAYNHPYQLTDWKFITGSEWTMPTVTEIKNAISTYGPVTAGVCVDDGWYGYSGGVYSPPAGIADSECGGYTNHQIVLVGWDDTTQTWILRNSWGSGWGDDGYMHIKWDTTGETSRVGEGASWVTLALAEPTPAAPALLAPASNSLITDPTPEFSWKSTVGASTYEVQISTSSTFSGAELLDAGTATTYSPSSDLIPDGKWYWHVRGKNASDVSGAWSATRYFILATGNPAAPTLKFPLNGATPLGTPTFSWIKPIIGRSVRYQFQYNISSDPGTDDPASVTFRSPELTSTAYKPPLAMPMVEYYWFARAKDAAGNWSDWSDPFTVTVQPLKPLAPVQVAPKSNFYTNDATPELTWKSVLYGATYQVQVSLSPKFIGAPELPADTPTSYTTDPLTRDGKYYWRVRATNENLVSGNWSAARYFILDTDNLDAPALKLPLNGAKPNSTPTFSWIKPAGSPVRYQFQYNTSNSVGTDDPASVTYRSGELTSTTFKPPAMPMVKYYWFVRAKDAAGNWSDWSAPFTLTVQPLKPLAPKPNLPATAFKTDDTTPSLSWFAVAYGYAYEVQVDDNAKFLSPNYKTDPRVSGLSDTTDELVPGKYYWRVRAWNEAGTYGPWSAVRYFTILPTLN